MKSIGNAAALLIGMLACAVQAASFDCAKAVSLIEKAICSESRLSRLDDRLAAAYRETAAETVDIDRLKTAQLAWLKARNRCQDHACLADAYERRIGELDRQVEKISGVLVGGGGVDDMLLNIRAGNGRVVRAYCNGRCGDWFVADRDGVYSLSGKLVNQAVRITVTRQRNKGRIAGPGEQDVLPFVTRIDFPG